MARQGFSKLTAFKAFSKMDKACTSGCRCSALCQLFMAKEFLGYAVQTGEKFSDKIPDDIIDMYRSVPLKLERYDQMELMDAFNEVQSICDDCSLEEHDAYCTVNVVLSGLGILAYGKDFETDKDKQINLVQ